MKSDALGYYQILQVAPTAANKQIKLSYHEQAKIWHPDYNKSAEAMEHFQKISVAYDVLQDEAKRLSYDLLSLVYDRGDFPQLGNLSILKDRFEAENPEVRVFDLKYVVGKVYTQKLREERLVCNQTQAKNEILKCSLANWALGWWSIKAFPANLRALFANFRQVGANRADNLKLLVHNAVAFAQEGKNAAAVSSALQAKEFADAEAADLLERFCQMLDGGAPRPKIASWNYGKMKFVQLLIPLILLLTAAGLGVQKYGWWQYRQKQNEITYFQKVRYNNGGEFTDDIVVSKVFSVPVNPYSPEMLYHLKNADDIMYGPADKFDVMKRLAKGHTVRVTGFTPDKAWYRVMIDNGDMGFIRAEKLKKGLGNPVPENSKVYQTAY